MSVRRRAIQERRDRDGMRRKEYEATQRWIQNVRALVQRKLLRAGLGDDSSITLEELSACFDPPVTSEPQSPTQEGEK